MKASHKWAVDRALAHEPCPICKLQNLKVEVLHLDTLLVSCDSCNEISSYNVVFVEHGKGSGIKSSKVEALFERN